MDSEEAREILRRHLETFGDRPYAELVALIGETQVAELTAQSGKSYQIEVEALWDSEPGGSVLVVGSIDDGKWRAFFPLTQSFIMSPDGSLGG